MTTSQPPIPSADEQAATPSEVSPLWLQPPGREKFWRFCVNNTVAIAAAVAMWLMVDSFSRGIDAVLVNLMLACFSVAAFVFIAIAAHELGHFICARLAGMTVIRVQIGHLELLPSRRRWRFRWRKTVLKAGGFVIAVPDIAKPLRAQMLGMMAGGVLGNLATAGLAFLAAVYLSGAASTAALAFAIFSVGYAVANCFPVRVSIPSDGMQFFAWLRHRIPDDHPELASLRLMRASLAGITADRVDENDVRDLETGLLPSRILAAWIRLKAAQMRSEWPAAVAHGQTFETLFASASPELAVQLADLHWMAQIETAFSQSLADARPDALRTLTKDDGPHWLAPYLWPRVQALLAAFDGNISAREALLAESKRWAEQSVDGAVGVGERVMREVVAAVSCQAEKAL